MNDLVPDPLPASIDPDRAARVVSAIRACWSDEFVHDPELWSVERPSTGLCEVSSIALWDAFGGEMVLSAVFVDGEQTEHHWWNRIDGVDIDLTRAQFHGHEEIRIVEVFAEADIVERRREFRPDLLERSDRFSEAVAQQLA